MTSNSVSITSNHKGVRIIILIGGKLTLIDATKFSRHHFKLLTNELWRWKESGYKGYPDLSIGK